MDEKEDSLDRSVKVSRTSSTPNIMRRDRDQDPQLPLELLIGILSVTDIRTLYSSCILVCRLWKDVITDHHFMRDLCIRDFPNYVTTNPVGFKDVLNYDYEKTDTDPSYPKKFKVMERICLTMPVDQDILTDPNFDRQDDLALFDMDLKAQSTEEEDEPENATTQQYIKWLVLYKTCIDREKAGTIDVSGYYSANYGIHGDEIVYINHNGFNLDGVKIIGDRNVPAGKPTFSIRLLKDQIHGRGAQHLADIGYLNPRWGRATFAMADRNLLVVRWHFIFPALSRGWYTKTLKFCRLEGYQPTEDPNAQFMWPERSLFHPRWKFQQKPDLHFVSAVTTAARESESSLSPLYVVYRTGFRAQFKICRHMLSTTTGCSSNARTSLDLKDMRYLLFLSLTVLLACAQVAYPNNPECGWGDQTYRAIGDWVADASGQTSGNWNAAEPRGVMQPTYAQACEYAVTVRNLVAGKSYSWKVSIGGTMDVNWGCVGRGGPNCAFTADSTGSIVLKIVASYSYTLSSQAAPAATKSSTVAASTTKASTVAASTTTTTGYQYLGCYRDDNTRDLSGAQSSVSSLAQCYTACQGYKYFAVQYSTQCYCGNTYGTYGVMPETDCNMNCTNGDTKCGAGWRNSVYSIGATPTAASTTKAITSSTTKASTVPATTTSPFQYVGCYRDDNTRDLSVAKPGVSSLNQCYTSCQGYKYFGVQYSTECYCGNTYGTYGAMPETDCNMNCQSGETRCGGSYRNSIYSTGANPTTKASTSSTQTPATTQVAQTPNGKVVMAHFMMGYAAGSGADYNYFFDQCTLAKAVGIDVFIVNVGADSWTATKMGYMLQAAQAVGIKAAFSFDMYAQSMGQDKVREYTNQFVDHAAYYRYNGRPFVSTFGGREQTWWSSWKTEKNVYFCPAFLGDITTVYSDFSFIDCAFSWDAWGPSTSNDRDKLAISRSSGKKYMAGVAPWFYVKWDGGKNWMWMDGTPQGDENIYATRWQQVIASGAQFVEVITWNDFSESSYIGPLREVPRQGPNAADWSSVPSYVNNPITMNHGGFYGMTAFYANYFKTGNGTPTKNTLYWHYRIHNRDQTRSGDSYGKPTFYWTPNDCVGIHAISLRTGATFTVQIGNYVSPVRTIGSTLYNWCEPFNGATGAVKVNINLNGATKIGSGGPDIQSSGNYYNFNMWSGAVDY
ncbi:hypothetical protein PROFUN_06147 [Planoprotostelium fungivorum]|uniref:WSC domain-containing protein n=1 Tax=Planoprotostelium fungivorum TaxID=1890364 RepID=A0A2P6NPI5_9EUKA|nr:hypothetical protein PROFUN_06147 [Planoprotostelium fungivorum]